MDKWQARRLSVRGKRMRIGFIVNPVAGMGGKVGLKGTDGNAKEAAARGAVPIAPQRAVEFLANLKQRISGVELVCCPRQMGEDEAQAVGLPFKVLTMKIGTPTSDVDTKKAAQLLGDVDLIVFVGGDGTARNVFDSLNGKEIPVLGVPSGVKMYSGIFAVSPSDAAEAVTAFVEKRAEIADFEVMDADEDAIRKDIFDVRLYGCLKGISIPALIQGSKEVSPETFTEKESQEDIAHYVVEELPEDATLILGPGSTVERIAEELGVKKTVLGVDLYCNGTIFTDVDEKTLLETIKDWNSTWIILSPIGHQGLLLGRGNQQISASIVKRVGKNHVLVVATVNKLQGLGTAALRVDTGDEEVNTLLQGEIMVVTGYKMGVKVPVR
jgi:predicted polyphosphate/ATP-dependent NAD kinase